MRLLPLLLFIILSINVFSQNVGIGTATPHASSQMDITSTNKGLLLPRMTTAAISAIPNPAKGLLVYDSVTNQLMVNMGNSSTPVWQTIVAKSGWGLKGNAGTIAGTDFIGTTDGADLRFRVHNIKAGLIGDGFENTFLGMEAGLSSTGTQNVVVGRSAGRAMTTGSYNVAVGAYSLDFANGNDNTAVGFQSMRFSTSGSGNSAFGNNALYSNSTGAENTAVGLNTLFNNYDGSFNVATGSFALGNNRNSYNTGVGSRALGGTVNSQYNTGVGYRAGEGYDNGYNNVFVGANADVNGTGYYNVIAIGQGTVAPAASYARFGNAATVSYGGWAGWSNLSDGRFKKNVQENVPGITFINKLRAVTYNLEASAVDAFLHRTSKNEMSAEGNTIYQKALREKEQIIYTGFIAQEVETAAKQLGFNFSGVEAPSNDNDTYSLRYAEFVVPLVKGMQEQQELIMELKSQNEELKKRVEKLEVLLGGKR